MKIFWEAATITMTASVTTEYLNLGSVTGSANRTIAWGLYDDNSAGVGLIGNDLRSDVKTAAEMLCYISDKCSLRGAAPYPTHTFFRQKIDQGFEPWRDPGSAFCSINPDICRWATIEQMFISPRIRIDGTDKENTSNNVYYAPFAFALENADIISQNNGIYLDAYEPERPNQGGNSTKLVGAANFVTPWGSWSVNLAGGLAVTDASMTITVTAADPAVRYGKPKV